MDYRGSKKLGFLGHRLGSQGRGHSIGTLPNRSGCPSRTGISVMVVERPASGLVFERAIDSVGHRAHLLPQFNLKGVSVSRDNALGNLGGGLALTAACFSGAAALVGI